MVLEKYKEKWPTSDKLLSGNPNLQTCFPVPRKCEQRLCYCVLHCNIEVQLGFCNLKWNIISAAVQTNIQSSLAVSFLRYKLELGLRAVYRETDTNIKCRGILLILFFKSGDCFGNVSCKMVYFTHYC